MLDHYLGVKPAWDWLGAYTTLAAQQRTELASATTKETARDTTVRPTLPLPKYAGTYSDVWYGDVTVGSANGQLTMRFSHTPELTGVLEHQKGDAFIVRWKDRSLRADAVVTFDVKAGAVTRVRMVPTPGVDFSFDFQDLDLRPKRGGK